MRVVNTIRTVHFQDDASGSPDPGTTEYEQFHAELGLKQVGNLDCAFEYCQQGGNLPYSTNVITVELSPFWLLAFRVYSM